MHNPFDWKYFMIKEVQLVSNFIILFHVVISNRKFWDYEMNAFQIIESISGLFTWDEYMSSYLWLQWR